MNAKHENLKITPYDDSDVSIQRRVFLVETYTEYSNQNLHETLSALEFELVEVAKNTTDLLKRVEELCPDVLILSVDFLDAFTLDQLIRVNQSYPLPIVVFAKQHAPEILNTVVEVGVTSYVVDDIQAHRLPVIIDLAMVRFAKIHSLSTELQHAKEKLSERKLIEKAKGILMQQKGLSEEQAYSQMRTTAMNQGQSMARLSERIIAVFEMLD